MEHDEKVFNLISPFWKAVTDTVSLSFTDMYYQQLSFFFSKNHSVLYIS